LEERYFSFYVHACGFQIINFGAEEWLASISHDFGSGSSSGSCVVFVLVGFFTGVVADGWSTFFFGAELRRFLLVFGVSTVGVFPPQ